MIKGRQLIIVSLCFATCIVAIDHRGWQAAGPPEANQGAQQKQVPGPNNQKRAEKPMSKKVVKSDVEWQKQLTPLQYQVTRKKGTERAFSGQYWDCKKPGIYKCVCCGNVLFRSDTKYDSGTGWPSFTASASAQCVDTEDDSSLLMRRTEVHCSRCGAHLGHVFDDGPAPTHLRYCINSASLDFEEKQ